MLERVIYGLGLFVGSMAIGYALGRKGLLTEPRAGIIMRAVVKWGSPVVLCLSFWPLDLHRAEVLVFPVIGAALSLSTLIPALGYARWARMTRAQTGAFLVCAMFSNLGFIGAFIAFALFGEEAYGLSTVYLLCFSPLFYAVGFGIAKRFGDGPHAASSVNLWTDELRFYPFTGLALGLGLNLANVPRPLVLQWLNHGLIPLNTAVYLAAIGSQLHVESFGRWLKPSLAMSAIKFVYSPLIAVGLVWLFRMHELPRQVVLIQATMPVAISPLMLPALFGLDRKLTSALFLFTTLAAIPWLLVYLPWIR